MQAPSWREALNPPIYLVSVLPGLGVPLLADAPIVHPLGLLLAALAVVLVQHAINLFNDAADWRLGADSEKFTSWVRYHDERPEIAVRHGAVSLLAGGIVGLVVLWQQQQLWILWLALPMVGAGYLYNAGPRPLSYTYLGEWVTGICYGPGVFGCLWLVAGFEPNAAMFAGSLAFGALAMALLLSHQPPQIDTDRQAGKQSFAVRFGAATTRRVARMLFLLFLAAVVAVLSSNLSVGFSVAALATAVLLLLRLALDSVNPKRILGDASLFTLATLAMVVVSS